MDNTAWFDSFRKSRHHAFLKEKPIAYFCIEYALSDTIPTYAGGLGVLAGDFVRELADQKIPAVAVGLLYHSIYGAHDAIHGKIVTESVSSSQHEKELVPVLDKNKTQLLIKVPILDHDVLVKVWLWEKNSIPVYLLDTDVTENTQVDRDITYKLYDSNKETRIKQEMVLGIGGFRVLEALGIQPSIYHMNEGHSALLDLEIIRHEMEKRKIGFQEAQSLSTHHVVFTNHTLVPAGNEVFSNDLFTLLLTKYASDLGVPVTELSGLGTIQESNTFSLSLFGLRLAGKINAVSQLHAKEAVKSWPDYLFEAVTNGIHLPSWDKVGNPASDGKNHGNSNEMIGLKHTENKRELLRYIKGRMGVDWKENELLLGWARRMVPYKRPLALFEDLKRFKEIAYNSERPVKVVITGIAHQGDNAGREIIQQLQVLIKKELSSAAVFLPDYSTTIAKLLTSGCDIWLNTPVVGSEACGTSGMKACLNGVLPCTTKDGWMAEVDVTRIGWTVASDNIQESLLQTISEQIVPLYYSEDKTRWEKSMKNGRELILHQYSATRMLKEYFEKLYLPIITTSYKHYGF